MENKLKNYIFLITYAIAIYFIFQNLSFFGNIAFRFIQLLMPFVYGFAIAYIVNWPSSCIKKFLNKNINDIKMCNIISIVLAYLFVFGIFAFISIIVIPQIILSFNHFISNSNTYIYSMKNYSNEMFKVLGIDNYVLIDNIPEKIIDFIKTESFMFTIFGFMKNFALTTYNWVVGLIISFYFMFNKDQLISKLKRIANICLSKKHYFTMVDILDFSHNVFGKFIVGKIIDSLIIGILCFIGTTVLNIPYSLLISVIVGVTNVIPFFGPFLGAIPSIFILLVIDPIKALWFAVFILILQQVDGNIIGPKILGSSVGISGLFIMFSVIIGGGLFGITGMILGVPIFVIIYNLFGNYINKKAKNIV